MKLTVLTENTCRCGLPSEHGLSIYIETGSRRILFDSGQSGLFAENAQHLGVDLTRVDTAVLSHGHYDHGGGLMRFLEINQTADVLVSRYAFAPFYNSEQKYIGLDAALNDSDRVILTDGVTDLGDGLTLYACNDRETICDLGAFGLTMVKNGERVPDDFRHEHYLMVEENGKKILFSGCSHKGILNIAAWFKPDILVGGFHLMKHPLDDGLIDYAKRLDAYDTDYYTCHCTGEAQYAYIKPYMRRLHYIGTGDRLEL